MAGKWTHEDFVDFVERETTGFQVVGRYVNNETKIEMFHEECGREFSIRPADFKRRKRCSPCNRKTKLTHTQYTSQVKEIVGEEYSILEKYINSDTKILTRHNICGYEWKITPSHLKGGKRCPKCSGRVRKTPEYFRDEIYELVGAEYSVLTDYVKAHDKVTFYHHSDVCGGHKFDMSPTDFLVGNRCTKCADIARSGVNHWNYNPNLTYEERQRRDMFNGEIRKWRDRIYERDDYTCQKCFEKGGRLNAHHILSWDNHPEHRFSDDNGVTLCNKCHVKFHQIFGYGENNDKQFEVYRIFPRIRSSQYRGKHGA